MTMDEAQLTQRRKEAEAKLAEWKSWLSGPDGHMTKSIAARLLADVERHAAASAASAAYAASMGAIEAVKDALAKQRDRHAREIAALAARIRELESAASGGTAAPCLADTGGGK